MRMRLNITVTTNPTQSCLYVLPVQPVFSLSLSLSLSLSPHLNMNVNEVSYEAICDQK